MATHRRDLTHSAPGAIERFNRRAEQQERQREIERQGLIESGANLFSAVSSIYAGELNVRAAALDASWQETRALYEEAAVQDALLDGMAMAEVAQAQAGFVGAPQLALNTVAALGEAQKMRRAIRLRARLAATQDLFRAGGQRVASGNSALGSGRKAASALSVARERIGEVGL